MNSQSLLQLNKDELDEIEFNDLPEAHCMLFCRYMDIGRHLQEIAQLFGMMQYNLNQLHKSYELKFDDRILPLNNEWVNVIQVNALVCNAVSSARTLVEAMEVFDKVFIGPQENFHRNYTANAYDSSYSYRVVDMLRNYMQHGHVPISYDGERIYFHLSEILDVKHMGMNAKLRRKLENIQTDILQSGNDTRLSCVLMLYEYFFYVYSLYSEFFTYIEYDMQTLECDVGSVLQEHPEYITNMNEMQFVTVYLDDNGSLHGFSAQDDFKIMFKEHKQCAESELETYKRNNGNLFRIELQYCLENRKSLMCLVGDEARSENLYNFCLKMGTGIRYVSFESYYGRMMMNSVYKLYPYIQFEDGVRWNVPYAEVRISDFLRTFPEAREDGLIVYANNVGGAGELFEFLMQNWSRFIEFSHSVLRALNIDSGIDALDWISRVVFVHQGITWLRNSFAAKKEAKPTVEFLCRYVRKQTEWNIIDMARNLHADSELLALVLESLGYVSRDSVVYVYDEDIAQQLQDSRIAEERKLKNNYGTSVNCYDMNCKLDAINRDLLYFATVLMEQGQFEEYDREVRECLAPLAKYNSLVNWNFEFRCLQVADHLPDDFDEKMAVEIAYALEEIDEQLNKRCILLEKEYE